ncbi:MAG: hypothetical protein U1E50_02700 [Caulobacteraceae bacterium]
MTKLFIATAAAAALAFAAMGAAAQPAETPAAVAAVAAVAAADGKPSIETTPISDLLANAGAKSVVDKYIPGLATAPQLDMVKGMSLRQLSQFPQAGLTPDKLNSIQTDFNALP